MHSVRVPVCSVACVLAFLAATGAARAADCPGHPDAIGTSRTIYVDPAEHARIGTMQYHETLPLNDHEVVLTFDDGPLPPKTNRVLDVLASECAKATFFIVGQMAQTYPATLKREYAEGHSIGTHTQDHPLNFRRAPLAEVEQEVDEGIASVTAVLGDAKDVAPFFRIPGLEREDHVDDYLNSRGLMIWSADFPADDWKHIRAPEVYRRALARIEARHKGVLLLHDIQPATVAALPVLLRELKRRGYHIVHVAPATADQPKTATEPSQWLMSGKKTAWTPEVISVDNVFTSNVPLPSEPAPLASPQIIGAVPTPDPSSTSTGTGAPLALTAPGPSSHDRVALRSRIPLPPARPHTLDERSASRAVPLPALNAQFVGHTGAPTPVRPDEHSQLTTGSIASSARQSTTDTISEAPKSATTDEPILRPSVDIPVPKAPMGSASNPPKIGTP
jgi:peptidoglycan/xylan/chitin deacetylase (PgdA/CDA1 family)